MKETLVYAIGNPSRGDDGIGHQIYHILKNLNLKIDLKYNYQLNIEDAELIQHYENVLFIDAAKNQSPEIEIINVIPKKELSFSSHALSPESISYLCHKLYKKSPRIEVLSIKGISFDLREGATPIAQQAIEKALSYLIERFKN